MRVPQVNPARYVQPEDQLRALRDFEWASKREQLIAAAALGMHAVNYFVHWLNSQYRYVDHECVSPAACWPLQASALGDQHKGCFLVYWYMHQLLSEVCVSPTQYVVNTSWHLHRACLALLCRYAPRHQYIYSGWGKF